MLVVALNPICKGLLLKKTCTVRGSLEVKCINKQYTLCVYFSDTPFSVKSLFPMSTYWSFLKRRCHEIFYIKTCTRLATNPGPLRRGLGWKHMNKARSYTCPLLNSKYILKIGKISLRFSPVSVAFEHYTLNSCLNRVKTHFHPTVLYIFGGLH